MEFEKRQETQSGVSHWVAIKGHAHPFARFCLNDLGKRAPNPELVAARDLMMSAPAMRAALDAAEYWLEADAATPEKTQPADILRTIRAALPGADLEPDTSDIPEAGPAFWRNAKLARPPHLDPRELGTVLAALRFYQEEFLGKDEFVSEHDLAVVEIATNCDSEDPMTAPEIDALCERLNTSPDPLAIPSAADLRKSRLADAGEDMLAALERSLFMLTSPTMPAFVNDGGTVDAVRAAIAKAKGEEIARQDYETAAKASGWTQSDNRLMWTRPRRESDTSEFAAASDSDRIAAKSARGACEIDSIDPVRG